VSLYRIGWNCPGKEARRRPVAELYNKQKSMTGRHAFLRQRVGNQKKISVTGKIQYRVVFLETSRFLNPSVPGRGLLFPSSPPSSTGQPPHHPATASYFGFTRKLLTASIFRYSAKGAGDQERITAPLGNTKSSRDSGECRRMLRTLAKTPPPRYPMGLKFAKMRSYAKLTDR